VQLVAAMLVVLDVAVLFAGVVARYVFNRPIIWSDELAAALFLWLGMLGAVWRPAFQARRHRWRNCGDYRCRRCALARFATDDGDG
jgi:TRAP-type C4-dicarboxylate transport system permease small subunit